MKTHSTRSSAISVATVAITAPFCANTGIKAAFKAIDHDKDVEMASQEVEVRGRNAKIEERLRKPMKGDGMANLNGNAGATAKRDIPELGVLNKYGSSADIWERGGMKRKKV